MTLTPAYGRDYKSKKAAVADFMAGKDFIIADYVHPYSGKPANINDMRKEGLSVVNVRYAGLRRIAVVNF